MPITNPSIARDKRIGAVDGLDSHPALQVFQMVLNFLDQNIWPLIILVIVIVARKGIGRFVERMTKLSFSVGSATGEAEAVDRIIVADLPSRAEVDQKSSPPEAPKLEISDVKEKAEEGGDWFVQLYALFVSGDSAAATQVFEKQQRIEQDADQRFTNEASSSFFATSTVRMQRLSLGSKIFARAAPMTGSATMQQTGWHQPTWQHMISSRRREYMVKRYPRSKTSNGGLS